MRHLAGFSCFFAAWVIGLQAHAQSGAHTQAKLLLAAEAARPGETVMAGLFLHMDAGWHTYWKNPGASGEATGIKWRLPAGVTTGEIQWPLPEKTADGDLTVYIYEGDVVLLVPLKLAPDLKPGALELTAAGSWLECSLERCVPGKAGLQATLNIGGETKPSTNAGFIKEWADRLPGSAAGSAVSATARWEGSATGKLRPLIIEWNTTQTPGGADFFPFASDLFEVQPATERLPAGPGKVRLRKFVQIFQGGWPEKIGGVLVEQTAGAGSPVRKGYEVSLAAER